MGRNVDPREIFRNFDNEDHLITLITTLVEDARLEPSNADANQILITAMFYLAENLRRNGVASQKHASRLTFATCALVAATLMLALVALLQLISVG